jgi:hypothetical protein
MTEEHPNRFGDPELCTHQRFSPYPEYIGLSWYIWCLDCCLAFGYDTKEEALEAAEGRQ